VNTYNVGKKSQATHIWLHNSFNWIE